jgi:hypothetical protein
VGASSLGDAPQVELRLEERSIYSQASNSAIDPPAASTIMSGLYSAVAPNAGAIVDRQRGTHRGGSFRQGRSREFTAGAAATPSPSAYLAGDTLKGKRRSSNVSSKSLSPDAAVFEFRVSRFAF